MTIISLSYLGGVFPKPSQNLYSCGMEAFAPYYPQITTKIHDVRFNVLEELRDNFDSRIIQTPEFWKNRIITHFAVSPFLYSVIFVPFDLTSSQTWFVQKNQIGAPGTLGTSAKGFYAPYLSDEHRAQLGCIEQPDQLCNINNELFKSLVNIEHYALEETLYLLEYFLKDRLTVMIGFTYFDSQGELVSRFWYKG